MTDRTPDEARSLAFRPMRAEDLGAFAACFAANDDPKDHKVLNWQYAANPVGELFADLAVDRVDDTETIAGIYATFPVEFQIGPHRVIGVQSLDTLTDGAYRGRGLFTTLANAVYERCHENGVALVYGFPNGSSAPGFFGKLGWTRLGPVPFLFLPLRLRYFLERAGVPSRIARRLPNRLPRRLVPPMATADEEVAVMLGVDSEVDRLWEQFSSHVKISVVRDRQYLAWRLARPGGRYKLLAFRRAGELRGLAVIACKEKHGGKVGYVMELLHVPDDHRAGEILAHAAVDDLSRSGADVVLAWSLPHSPNRTTYRHAGFRSLPERIRPIELHFGARALAAPPDAAVGNLRNWYLSYLDSDTV